MATDEPLRHARARLRKRNWKVIDINRWLSNAAVSPAAKFSLASAGMSEGYYVAGEVPVEPDGSSQQRVNVVWFDTEEWEPAYAFEICGGVPERSVDKLNRLAEGSRIETEKVIVSKSPNPTFINDSVENNLPDDFHHIDVGFHEHR